MCRVLRFVFHQVGQLTRPCASQEIAAAVALLDTVAETIPLGIVAAVVKADTAAAEASLGIAVEVEQHTVARKLVADMAVLQMAAELLPPPQNEFER